MIHLLLSALLWLWNQQSFDQISRNNIARKEAVKAYQQGQYATAAERYTFLNKLNADPDPALLLNLGHSCFQLHQYSKAQTYYKTIQKVGNAEQITVADVQLGVIACLQKDSATALSLFQHALLQNPDNEPARYNFELISQTFSGRLPNPQASHKPTPKPGAGRQPTAANELTTTQAKTLVRSSQKNDKLNRFRNLNMTEAQARQILDAMQSNDLPYSLARHRAKSHETTPGNAW